MYGLQHVIFDTNVVGSDRHLEFFSSTCSTFVERFNAHPTLKVKWRVPAIVKLERIHQIALKLRENSKAISAAAKLFGVQVNLAPDELEAHLSEQIDLALERFRVTLVEIDFAKVNWASVVHDAAMRKSVFEVGETEKGFKDRMFLECVRQVLESGSEGQENALWVVTGDKVLADEIRLIPNMALNVVTSLRDLESEFNAREAHLGQQKLSAILQNANKSFYSENDALAIFPATKAVFAIKAKHPEVGRAPEGLGPLVKVYEHMSDAVFERQEGDRVHFSNMFYVTPYFMKRIDADMPGVPPPPPPVDSIAIPNSGIFQTSVAGVPPAAAGVASYFVGVPGAYHKWALNWSARIGPHLDLTDITVDHVEKLPW